MSYWSFALINGRLAEIYFDKQGSRIVIEGHCYLADHERWTQSEANDMQKDLPDHQFTYYNKKYRKLI